MILGLGNDIVSVKRIEKILETRKEAFLAHFFSPEEKAFFKIEEINAPFIAGRWAAKEACVKALGCGFGKDCSLQDIMILREATDNASGRPVLTLSGPGKEKAGSLGVKRISLSISHEKEFACATVILED